MPGHNSPKTECANHPSSPDHRGGTPCPAPTLPSPREAFSPGMAGGGHVPRHQLCKASQYPHTPQRAWARLPAPRFAGAAACARCVCARHCGFLSRRASGESDCWGLACSAWLQNLQSSGHGVSHMATCIKSANQKASLHILNEPKSSRARPGITVEVILCKYSRHPIFVPPFWAHFQYCHNDR